MFTGLIEEVGAVVRQSGFDLAIMAKTVLEDLRLGHSIAVNGACLTVAAVTREGFVAQLSPETLQRTTLGQLRPGDAVNLERALPANGRFGGHFVLGHVDGVGRVAGVRHEGEFSLWQFQAGMDVARYLAPKGSVAIDGISLTVLDPAGDTFGAAVIPTTMRNTTLGTKRPGDSVNIETDVIAKHIHHYLKGAAGKPITLELLKRHGFA